MPNNSSEQRKLAAIMFTDMVGYSALAQKNEALALKLLDEHRQLLRPLFPKHSGAEIKTIGDAFLVEFHSALDAVRCAVEMQKVLTEYNASSPETVRILIRIGIHVGDVVHRENDVFGDGVNIAARIEPLAEPGGICVTQQVYDHVHNKLDAAMLSLGKGELKNIQLPVKLYRVVLPWEKRQLPFAAQVRFRLRQRSTRSLLAACVVVAVVAASFLWRSYTPLERTDSASDALPGTAKPVVFDKRKLAVLPFDNFSSEKDKFEYFADGMTEQMISKLSRVSGLTVKARNAVMKYKGGAKDIPAIGRELGVGTVLESSVRREGNQLRITVQLIDAQTQDHLWSDDFDKAYQDVFAIQSEVAEGVAAALKVKLLGEETQSIRKRPTESLEAYDYYLRGKFFFATDREATDRSIEMLEKATALDGTFAEAYAEVSVAYSNKAYFLGAGEKQWETKAETAIAKALQLDANLPEAHLAQAHVFFRPSNGFQHEKAIAEIRQALAVRSNLDDAYMFLGAICWHVGLIDHALEQYKKADEINPGNPTVKWEIAGNELFHGRYEKAVTLMEAYQTGLVRALAESSFANALLYVGRTNDAKIRIDEALRKIQDDPSAKLKDDGGILTAMQALLLAVAGDKTQAEAKIQEALKIGEGFGHFHHTAHVIASAYSRMNELDSAMKWLRYAAENGYPNLTWFKRDPNLANLRKDPRFDELMEELRPRFERLKKLVETPLKETK